jgi:two-component system, NarL family, nitrate/nitrite response regulator NarL
MPISLILADDHPLILKGLSDLFHSEQGFDVVAQCTDGEQALAAVRAHRPDVLVLDLNMPRKDGFAVLRAMREDRSPTRVVLLVADLADDQLVEATRLGVRGVLLKEMAPHLLVQCVRKVHAGETWVEKRSLARAFEALLRRESGTREIGQLLTPREIEIVRLAVKGLPNSEIAERLSIAEGTIKTHLHHIYEKLKVASRLELLLYCKEKGIL